MTVEVPSRCRLRMTDDCAMMYEFGLWVQGIRRWWEADSRLITYCTFVICN